jgi:hypothetical protein
MTGHEDAHPAKDVAVERIPPAGDAGLFVGIVVAGLIEDGIKADVGPGLISPVKAWGVADQVEVVGSLEVLQAANGDQLAGRGVEDDGFELFLSPSLALKPVVLVGQELLQALYVDLHDSWGVGEAMVSAVQDATSNDGATAKAVLMEEGDDALEAQIADVVGIGAVFEEESDGLAFEGLGLDDGGEDGQVGVSPLKAIDVDHRPGPDAVELAIDLDASRFQITSGLVGEEDVLVQESHIGIGQKGGVALTLLEQAGEGH